MNKRPHDFCCAGLALLAASVAGGADAAQAEGYYVGGSAAVGHLASPDSSTEASNRDFPALQADFGTGGVFNLAVGYAGDQLRLELAYVNLSNKISGAGAAVADSDRVTAMGPFVNVAYKLFPERRWHPYIGAGVGYLFIDLQSTEQQKFSLQAALGVEYDLLEHVSLSAGAQLVSAGNTQFNKNTTNEFAFDCTSTSYGVSARYYFGG